MFMWMLHEKIMKYRNVYVNVTWRDNEISECYMKYQNVYVNVTWRDNGISKCLCECYMKR
jgi:hypothetical protein